MAKPKKPRERGREARRRDDERRAAAAAMARAALRSGASFGEYEDA